MVNLDWDWLQKVKNEKENEFLQWLKTWYEEHVQRPQRIIAEIEYDYKSFITPQIGIRIEQPKLSNLVDEHGKKLSYIEKVSSKTDQIQAKETILKINKVNVKIAPFSDEDTEGILLLNEQLNKNTRLRVNLFLKKINEQFKDISPEMAICHISTIYILNYDWNNRNVPKKSFITALESKKGNQHLLTIKQLLDSFSKKHDLGFNCLIKCIQDHRNEIESFDLIPPIWINFLQQHIRKDEINSLKNLFPQQYDTICQMDAKGESPDVIRAFLSKIKSELPNTNINDKTKEPVSAQSELILCIQPRYHKHKSYYAEIIIYPGKGEKEIHYPLGCVMLRFFWLTLNAKSHGYEWVTADTLRTELYYHDSEDPYWFSKRINHIKRWLIKNNIYQYFYFYVPQGTKNMKVRTTLSKDRFSLDILDYDKAKSETKAYPKMN